MTTHKTYDYDLETAEDGATGLQGPTFPRGPREGFTIVEILTVMMVAGILMGIMLPSIDTARFQLDAGAQEIASAIAGFRGKALLRQHDVVLTFDAAEDRFFVLNDTDNDGASDTGEDRRVVELPTGVTFGRGGAPTIWGLVNAIAFTKVSEGLPALTFHRNGAASEEGVLYLTSVRGAGGTEFAQDSRALLVERATGRVRCMSYRTEQWIEGC